MQNSEPSKYPYTIDIESGYRQGTEWKQVCVVIGSDGARKEISYDPSEIGAGVRTAIESSIGEHKNVKV